MGQPIDNSEIELLDRLDSYALIAGVDEVGRGALFGPVVAAAIVLPYEAIVYLQQLGVKDSKQLSAKRRNEYAQTIKTLVSGWRVGYAKVQEIDRMNIFWASLLAMQRAVSGLKLQPQLCLVDGKHSIPNLSVPQLTIVKGDRRSPVIAAASIVAKVWRDELICRWASQYPHYDLIHNKGYGTKKHLEALQQYGSSTQHRLSFRPCR